MSLNSTGQSGERQNLAGRDEQILVGMLLTVAVVQRLTSITARLWQPQRPQREV